MIDQDTLALIAAVVEIGIPAAIGGAMLYVTSLRPRLIVLLGATTPVVLACSLPTETYATYFYSSQSPFLPGYISPWVEAIPLYAVSLLFAAALLFLRRPQTLLARYFLGSGAILCAYLLLFQILPPPQFTA